MAAQTARTSKKKRGSNVLRHHTDFTYTTLLAPEPRPVLMCSLAYSMSLAPVSLRRRCQPQWGLQVEAGRRHPRVLSSVPFQILWLPESDFALTGKETSRKLETNGLHSEKNYNSNVTLIEHYKLECTLHGQLLSVLKRTNGRLDHPVHMIVSL